MGKDGTNSWEGVEQTPRRGWNELMGGVERTPGIGGGCELLGDG